MTSIPLVRLRRHAVLAPSQPSDGVVSVGVGPAGEAVVVWTGPTEAEKLRSATTGAGGATFLDARPGQPIDVRITTHWPELGALVPIRNFGLAHPMVQPLPDGRVLLVGARCRTRAEGPDVNAVVVDAAGAVVAAGTVGDGVGHVLATPTGDIWVGYFDEGVFGNYGWGSPGPNPVGSPGLVRWSVDLEIVWRYPFDSGFGPINDCYALNVDGEMAWACYYSNFPIVKVDEAGIEGWRTDVGGARALIVCPPRAALVGGYGPDRDRVVLGQLSDGRFDPSFTGRLVLDDGCDLPPARLVGRGPDLHVFVGNLWYRLSIDDIGQTS